jgi:tetratricopeptide (TPR) repeat protein
MSNKVSTEEQEQILQTIEMFEVITQTNPDDCQSLEILKEAYWRLGKQKEALTVTRKLADAYMAEGQYSSAMMEYEGILQKDPNSPGIAQLLAAVEAKLNLAGKENGYEVTEDDGTSAIDLDFSAFANIQQEEASLMATDSTRKLERAKRQDFDIALTDDGNEPFARFLIQQRIIPEDVVQNALERVTKMNENLEPQAMATPLLSEIVVTRVMEMPALLCAILDRTKFAYVPLASYDIDRQVVKMLPESLTLGRLIVPFDIISRTVMIAMANPFDSLGKEAVQQLLDYNIQWHIADPEAITKVLRDSYRLDHKE